MIFSDRHPLLLQEVRELRSVYGILPRSLPSTNERNVRRTNGRDIPFHVIVHRDVLDQEMSAGREKRENARKHFEWVGKLSRLERETISL